MDPHRGGTGRGGLDVSEKTLYDRLGLGSSLALPALGSMGFSQPIPSGVRFLRPVAALSCRFCGQCGRAKVHQSLLFVAAFDPSAPCGALSAKGDRIVHKARQQRQGGFLRAIALIQGYEVDVDALGEGPGGTAAMAGGGGSGEAEG